MQLLRDYGHGRERYDAIEEILTANEDNLSRDTAWEALEAAQQLSKPGEFTSNTQWSVVYDCTTLTAEYSIRRNWGDKVTFSLADGAIQSEP